MKKILAFILLSVAMVSCYEDYIFDFEYTGIYFPYQQDVRSFVVGEGMKFEVGAALGGVRKNTIDRNVSFILDNSLITPERLTSMQTASQPYIKDAVKDVIALELLPTGHYSITSTSTMVIETGEHSGTVVIRPDSATFLNDSVKTVMATYVLPFRITSVTNTDTILENKRTNVVGVKFENMLFGNYWHGGAAVINRPSLPDTTVVYKTTIPCPENQIWTLTTTGPNTLAVNGYSNSLTSAAATEIQLVLKGNNVYVGSATGSSFTFEPDGASSFNRPKLLQDRKIFLQYKYTDPGNNYTYHCTDTLTFRNRLRDGINEWFDTNPANYEK